MSRETPQLSTNPSSTDVIEAERLAALDRYDILDTPPEESFNRIARLTKRTFGMPIAIVSVIDAHRQWCKAFEGLPRSEAARSETFCATTIQGTDAIFVEDATTDARFCTNPFVTAHPGIRSYAGVPLRTPDGHNIGSLCAIDYKPRAFTETDRELIGDLAQLAMNELELRRVAASDMLTGALSRRAFKEAGEREVALARRHQSPLSCVAIDLDHLKSINDRFGRPAGDAVLRGTARTIQQCLRETDLFGRLGGDEFAVLLPGTDRKGASDAAERLRSALEHQSIVVGDTILSMTGTFGVAHLDASTVDLPTLLSHADEVLAEAKAAGRNKVVACRPKGTNTFFASRRVLKAGVIAFNHRHSTIDCTVRTLGEDRAGLDVSSTVGVPEGFELLIKADGFSVACRVTHRTERHLDVEFINSAAA